MVVFKLSSDKQFLRTFKGDPDIHVYEYLDDPNAFDMIRASNSRWKFLAKVGPHSASFTELENLGVRIRSNQLTQLVNDLTLTDVGGQTFHLIVNRQGLCFLYVNSPSSSVMRLRVNDHFGWSKYGVHRSHVGVVWNRFDMSSGAVLVSAAAESGGTVERLKKLVEEKDKELAALKHSLQALVKGT